LSWDKLVALQTDTHISVWGPVGNRLHFQRRGKVESKNRARAGMRREKRERKERILREGVRNVRKW